MPDVVTIREAVKRAKSDGIPVTEYALRRWIKDGTIPSRNIGAKVLLFYPNLVRYLQCQDAPTTAPGNIPGRTYGGNPNGSTRKSYD